MRDKIEVPAELFKELCQRSAEFARERWSFDPLEGKVQPYLALCELPRLSLHGREWWHKSAGNAYQSVSIYAGAERIAKLGPKACYGEHWLYVALQWLQENRPDLVPGYKKGDNPTIYLREVQGTYDIETVTRERNL